MIDEIEITDEEWNAQFTKLDPFFDDVSKDIDDIEQRAKDALQERLQADYDALCGIGEIHEDNYYLSGGKNDKV